MLKLTNETNGIRNINKLYKQQVNCQEVVLSVQEEDCDGLLMTDVIVTGEYDYSKTLSQLLLDILFENEIDISQEKSFENSNLCITVKRDSNNSYKMSFTTKTQ
jgi:hypothetical protein